MNGKAGSALRGEVTVPLDDLELAGNLVVPEGARGVVLFAHGSGSSRFSPRNRFVADQLNERGFATLLLDLLTADEEGHDRNSGQYRFDVGLLGERLTAAADWLRDRVGFVEGTVGCFGASTGSAAALMTAARRWELIGAVVSRGGRPDLAGMEVLRQVRAPTLLVVGGLDQVVIDLNSDAMDFLRTDKALEIVPRAGHLFEEPGALRKVAELAAAWFERHLRPGFGAGLSEGFAPAGA